MNLHDIIAGAVSAGMVRRFPAGLSALDPETQKPWPSIDAALEAMERSRTIATRSRDPETDKPKARARTRATPEKDAMIRRMAREGFTLQQIADRLDLGSVAFVHQRCVKLGITTRHRRVRSVAEVNYYADVLT